MTAPRSASAGQGGFFAFRRGIYAKIMRAVKFFPPQMRPEKLSREGWTGVKEADCGSKALKKSNLLTSG